MLLSSLLLFLLYRLDLLFIFPISSKLLSFLLLFQCFSFHPHFRPNHGNIIRKIIRNIVDNTCCRRWVFVTVMKSFVRKSDRQCCQHLCRCGWIQFKTLLPIVLTASVQSVYNRILHWCTLVIIQFHCKHL